MPSAPAISWRERTLKGAEFSIGEAHGSKCGAGKEAVKVGEDGNKRELILRLRGMWFIFRVKNQWLGERMRKQRELRELREGSYG